ncbi:uncharacterized protein LOC143828165 [Paroedura picta]|uniref:uncharacterized protein LOC143828165 n=1 Tax=Paroedura picta TaxID=143630 RepID=UPI004057AFA3
MVLVTGQARRWRHRVSAEVCLSDNRIMTGGKQPFIGASAQRWARRPGTGGEVGKWGSGQCTLDLLAVIPSEEESIFQQMALTSETQVPDTKTQVSPLESTAVGEDRDSDSCDSRQIEYIPGTNPEQPWGPR